MRTVQLQERVKEIRCLYAVSSLVAEPCSSIEETLSTAVGLIPAGFKYPSDTCARITYGDMKFTSPNFRETSWKLDADMILSGETIGRVEAYYLDKKPDLGLGPFLREENDLIADIARQLTVLIQREQANAKLRQTGQDLRKSLRELERPEQDHGVIHHQIRKRDVYRRASNHT